MSYYSLGGWEGCVALVDCLAHGGGEFHESHSRD